MRRFQGQHRFRRHRVPYSPCARASLGCPSAEQGPIEWADVRAFIEYNSGDEDLGFHVEFDGEPWASAKMIGPDGSELFDLTSRGALRDQGLSGNFFESAEPGIDELSREEFFARFPEGQYTLVGESLEGQPVESHATFTHLLPDPPVIISPAEDATIERGAVTISWEPVTDPSGTEVEVYSLQLFPVDPPEGQDPPELNIDFTLEVPPHITEIKIPPAILQAAVDYQFELMVVDAAGNQSFSVGTFTTAGSP